MRKVDGIDISIFMPSSLEGYNFFTVEQALLPVPDRGQTEMSDLL
jgi:hypothetical protein